MDSALNGLQWINCRDWLARLSANLRVMLTSTTSVIGKLMCTTAALLLCKVIIGFVSGYDVFLTIKYAESLPLMEMNPIGRWLMDLNSTANRGIVHGTVQQTATFVAAKVCGNFITFGVIEAMAHWRRPMAAVVATAVAIAQLCLLAYLVFASE